MHDDHPAALLTASVWTLFLSYTMENLSMLHDNKLALARYNSLLNNQQYSAIAERGVYAPVRSLR